MRYFLIIFLLLSEGLLAFAKLPDASPIASLLPLDFTDARVQKDYARYLEHPWVKQQPEVQTFSFGIIEDLLSVEFLLEKYPLPPSVGDPLNFLIQERKKLDQKIATFRFHLPDDSYHTLFLPPTPQESFPSPVAFNIYDRLYLGQNALGLPMYLEARFFKLTPGKEGFEEKEIISWHFKLLLKGEKGFEPLETSEGTAYVGFGKRDSKHFDPSHGFAKTARGIFFASRRRNNTLCLLFADLPKPEMKERLSFFKNLLKP